MQLGYLSLVISPALYNNIPNAAQFARSVDPGPLFIQAPSTPIVTQANPNPVPILLTNVVIATQKSTYNTNLQLYNKCLVVELALRNQITDAVKSDYLSALINAVIDKIVNDIPAIITFLHTMYGKISTVELIKRRRFNRLHLRSYITN